MGILFHKQGQCEKSVNKKFEDVFESLFHSPHEETIGMKLHHWNELRKD
jgi:hypothetical protein